MLALIMAGGVGERFWPQSSSKRPKQLLDLTGEGSMISLTLDRLSAVSSPEEIFVITNKSHADSLKAEIPRIPEENVIAEPEGKNTAPCIAVACRLLHERFGDVPVLVLPADHVIRNVADFHAAVRAAELYAGRNDVLVTFGIKPSRPETGYGYIRIGKKLHEEDGVEVFAADAFLEKPDRRKAERFLSDGGYYWNSGIFLWRLTVILEALDRYFPELTGLLAPLEAGTKDLESVLNTIYPKLPAQSIDYAVMEKADNVVVVRGDFYWNDVGSWESIRELYDADENGNVLVGDHIVLDGRRNTVYSTGRTVGLLGVDDLVVVEGEEGILVCKRDRAQEVRRIAKKLKG
jgi:mannose-1-phosphate guanylyltransferase